jgi:hypothetical protein
MPTFPLSMPQGNAEYRIKRVIRKYLGNLVADGLSTVSCQGC